MRERLKKALARLKTPAFWLVLLFWCALIVPTLIWNEMDEEFRAKKLVWENRATRGKPTFQIRRYQRYPKEFAAYYNDAFPFREYLVLASRKITGPLNNFFSPRVIIGKNGFLFSADPVDRRHDDPGDYTGSSRWSKPREAAIVRQLEHTRRELAKRNIGFYVVIAPNKMAVYDDMLPEKRRFRKADVNRAESLVARAAEMAPELNIKYLADVFKENRREVEYPLFLFEDSHWNSLGGYLATREVVNRIPGCTKLPPLKSAQVVKTSKTLGGDLRVLLGGGTPKETQKYRVVIPGAKEVKVVERVDYHRRETSNPDAPNRRRIWVYRDSFASAMESYLGMLFTDVVFYWYVLPCRIQFEKDAPDIVVLEIAECALSNLEELDFESADKAQMKYFR